MKRREFCRGVAVVAIGTGGFARSALSLPVAQVSGATARVGEIYELQAAFHRAKTTQEIELMMSLRDEGGTSRGTRTRPMSASTDSDSSGRTQVPSPIAGFCLSHPSRPRSMSRARLALLRVPRCSRLRPCYAFYCV